MMDGNNIKDNNGPSGNLLIEIDSQEITQTFERAIGRQDFGIFIRMLVRNENAHLSEFTFHGGQENDRRGWDGTTTATSASAHVPEGKAIWEIGTNQDARQKAERDFTQSLRKGDLSADARSEISYIFVTSREWAGAGDWAREKEQLGHYKSVRAYDVAQLKVWLESLPAVQLWLAERLGKPVTGIVTVKEYWERYSNFSNPALNPTLFDDAKQWIADDLVTWVTSGDKSFVEIQAATKEEVGAALGAIASMDENVSDGLSNCVIVERSADLERLAIIAPNIIPIALDEHVINRCVEVFRDRPVIAAKVNNIKGRNDPKFTVERPSRESLKAALSAMNFDDAEAEQWKGQTGGAISVLRRQLAKSSAGKNPTWGGQLPNPRILLPIFFAGVWNDRKDDDREFVSALAEKFFAGTYEQVKTEVIRLSQIDDAPFWFEGNYYGVTSKLDCLSGLGSFITDSELITFFEWAELILGEYDPALDLPEDQRWCATIYKKERKASDALRKNIADTCILLAEQGTYHVPNVSGSWFQCKVDTLISSLLPSGDTQQWLSNTSLLTYFAEASPQAFLDAVEREIKASSSVMDQLFSAVGSSSFGYSPDRTSLLWALECLAWDARYTSPVCFILSELCNYPCNDNYTNRPINSLHSILLYWYPQTKMDVDGRISVLRAINNALSEVAWSLLLRPLQQGSGSTGENYRPKWRDFAVGAKKGATYDDIYRYADVCRELILQRSYYSADMLCDLIEGLENFPETMATQIEACFADWFNAEQATEERIQVLEKLRKRVRTRRALKDREQRDLEGVYDPSKLHELLKPQSLIESHAWLFLSHFVDENADELDDLDAYDYEKREARIAAARQAAIGEIWESLGIDGIKQLMSVSKACFEIGLYLSELNFTFDELVNIIKHFYADGSLKARDFVSGTLLGDSVDEIAVFQHLIATCQQTGVPFDASDFALLMKCNSKMLDVLELQGAEAVKQYWSTVSYHRVSRSGLTLEDLIEAFLSVGRPLAALELTEFQSSKISTDILVKLLEALMNPPEVVIDQNLSIGGYHIGEMMKELSGRRDIDKITLVRLEFAYVRILTGPGNAFGSIPALSEYIIQNPAAFFDLIVRIYRRRDHEDDAELFGNISDEDTRANLAESAYTVLDNIDVIPGSDQINLLDQIASGLEWYQTVITLAERHDREAITKQTIGQLFSRAGASEDGVWPNEHVRGLLNQLRDEEVNKGFRIGKQNQRGVVRRPSPDNGDPERKLASQYRADATKILAEYPYAARVLESIAESYEAMAEHHDQDGRLSKQMNM